MGRLKDILLKAVEWITAPAVREPGVFLTTVVTLVPMSFSNLYRYVVLLHRLPAWIPEYLHGSVGIAAIAAWLLAGVALALGRWPRVRRVFKVSLYVLLFGLWAMSLFLLNNFNTLYTSQMLTLAAETNGGETTEFLKAWIAAPGTLKALAFWLLTLLMTIVLERRRKAVTAWLQAKRWRTVVLALLLLFVAYRGAWVGSKIVTPYNSLYELEIAESDKCSNDVITQLHQSLVVLHFQKKETARAVELTLRAAERGDAVCDADSLTVVLVIGESYNKHHSSLYGYPLETSPLMAAERDSGRLVVMTDAVSTYNLTSSSIKDLLSLNSVADSEHWYERPLWPAVMRSAGLDVAIWDNQRDFLAGSIFTFSLNSILYDPRIIKKVYTATNDSTFAYDADMVGNYANRRSAATRALVIFHLMGQHTSYDQRYPHDARWQRFTAADVPQRGSWLDDSRRQIIADYDNSVRYNDYVLSLIIELFRDRNAVVVMLSDHGEEVYDYRDFMERDHNPEKSWPMLYHENQVPLLVWFSDGYAQRWPEKVEAVKAAAARPLMLDNLGQALMWLGATTSPYTASSRNVFSPQYKPGRRLLYDSTVDYDRVRVAGRSE